MPFDQFRNLDGSPALSPPVGNSRRRSGAVEISLEKLRCGDPSVFRAIVIQHRPWMLVVARRYVKDASLAEDCVQDAFASAYRHRFSFEGRSSLKSWLHRVTVNAALMKLRSRRRHDDRAIDELPSDLGAESGGVEPAWGQAAPLTPEQLLAQAQVAAKLRAKIEELPKPHRDILRLRDLEERGNAEAALLLNITEGAAKVRLHRARAALRRLLADIASELR